MKTSSKTPTQAQILDRMMSELKQYGQLSGRQTVKPVCDLKTAKKVILEAVKAQAAREGFSFELTPQLKKLLPELAAYFTGNKCSLNLRKGIFLWGPCGSGKTFLMRSMQLALNTLRNQSRSFKMVSVPRVYNELFERDRVYLSNHYADHRCFDDLGFHTTAIKNWGNQINPIEMILTHRYTNFVSRNTITHITSNLPLKQVGKSTALDQILDERIISRLQEMMNFVLVTGKDFRSE